MNERNQAVLTELTRIAVWSASAAAVLSKSQADLDREMVTNSLESIAKTLSFLIPHIRETSEISQEDFLKILEDQKQKVSAQIYSKE